MSPHFQAWHSCCDEIISFLPNEPEEDNLQENYLLDQVEREYQVKFEELKVGSSSSMPCFCC